MNDIIKFIDGEIEVDVRFDGKTIWLRQDEIAKIFGKDRSVITRHIDNILKDKEVDIDSNVQKMHFANFFKGSKEDYFFPPFGGQFPLPLPDGLPVVLGIFGTQFLVFAIFTPF